MTRKHILPAWQPRAVLALTITATVVCLGVWLFATLADPEDTLPPDEWVTLRVCLDAPPSDYAADAARWAAEQWRCVRIVDDQCDVSVAWLHSRPVVPHLGGEPGLCSYNLDARRITCGSAAWEGGVASPARRALAHEIGHGLGMGHQSTGIMMESLDASQLGGIDGWSRRRGCTLWTRGESELVGD